MNQSESSTPGDRFAQILQFQTPAALAWIRGNTPYAPGLSGMVRFYDTPYGGVLIEGEFFSSPIREFPAPPTSTPCISMKMETAPRDSHEQAATIIPQAHHTPGIPAIFCLLWETAGMDGFLSMTSVLQ